MFFTEMAETVKIVDAEQRIIGTLDCEHRAADVVSAAPTRSALEAVLRTRPLFFLEQLAVLRRTARHSG